MNKQVGKIYISEEPIELTQVLQIFVDTEQNEICQMVENQSNNGRNEEKRHSQQYTGIVNIKKTIKTS